MSYRTLLVGLADPGTAPRVVSAAAELAREHAAHLLVVHVMPAVPTRESGLPVADLAERLRAVYLGLRDDDAFTSEWCLLDDSVLSAAEALIELGNTSDALVLGQRPARKARRSRWPFSEHVVGATARPVLLVPDDGSTGFARGRVLIAWDGGEVANRAVFDALPLLQHASSVHLHRFNPPTSERRHVTRVAEAIAAALARHGVSLEMSRADTNRLEIGEAILEVAKERSADVIVMGRQVHGRLREFLLGDTTHHVMANATCPVLLGG